MNVQSDWDDLRYVLALTRERTLSGAATVLGVTHTTVGRRLRRLEEELDTRLFDRTPDGLELTEAGRELADAAARVEEQILAVEHRLLGRDSRLRGPLRVATMDMLYRRHMAVFNDFVRDNPEVDLTILVGDDPVSLTRREADVVLRLTSSPPEYLVGRKVGTQRFGVYAATTLADEVGRDAPWSAFPWIHVDERSGASRWLDGWLDEHAPGADVVMRIGSSSVMLGELVASGVGVHFQSIEDGDADPRLVRIGPLVEITRDVWLLTMPDLRHNARVRAFMQHVAGALTD